MKNEIQIVEEILQTVGLEEIGSRKSKGSQLKSIRSTFELISRIPRKKEIKEAPLIKLGSHNA